MTRLKTIDTSKWPEVYCINSYAVFMGHLSMGVRGLGFLVFTWTTVVLLGGFVSTLQKKDFWGLTAITLIQVAGVFDAFLKEKLVNIWSAYRGLVSTVKLTVLTDAANPYAIPALVMSEAVGIFLGTERSWCMVCLHNAAIFWRLPWNALRVSYGFLVQIVVLAIQGLVFAIILCPLAALYMVGLYFSAAVSLWRLIEHDYIVVTDASADALDPSKANLKPALDVLYSLALAQGVFFCYKTIFSFSEKKIIQHVAGDYKFVDQPASQSLLDYLEETRMGCEKDVSFARGRNLIAYAVDLMESNSPDRYISGIRIVDALISLQAQSSSSEDSQLLEQHSLIKQLLTGDIIHKLVQTLRSRSPYDRQTRVCAARILAYVAGEIHLEELPRGMQCIASLLITFKEYLSMETCERDWRLERHGTFVVAGGDPAADTTTPHELDASGYKELVLPGLRMIGKLAADKDNWRIMSSDMDDLLAMIMAPLSSEGFHDDHHKAWTGIAEGFIQLISQLMVAPAKSHEQLQLQIASSNQVINTVENILKCAHCNSLYKQAVEILLIDIHVDTSSILASRETRGNFIRGLVNIFADKEKQSSIRELTGQILVDMLSSASESDANIILDQDRKLPALEDLNGVVRKAKTSVCRIQAADILKHLCSHYTKDDELLKYLKEAMIGSIKKVLEEILPEESNGEEIQAVTEENNTKFSAPDTDVEAQHSGLNSQDSEQQNNNSASSSHHEQNSEKLNEAMELQTALISLCETIYDTLVTADPDLGGKLDEAAAEFCSKQGKPVSIFASLVKEAQERLDRKKAQESARILSVSSSSTAT